MGRFHGLDACRAAAMMLGLFFHGAISFLDQNIPWAIRDRSTHWGVDVFVWICHTFRMPVFFLLGGFFARLLYLKLGPAGFLRHRARRLLVPFVVALPPIMASLFFLWRWGYSQAPPASIHPLGLDVPSVDAWRVSPSPGHLWFLYYLMILLAMLVAVARFWPGDGVVKALDGPFRWLARVQLLPWVLAIPTACTVVFMKAFNADTPVSFVPQPRILAYYGVFMGVGWMLHRHADLVALLWRRLWIPLLFAAAAFAPLAILEERLSHPGAAATAGGRVAGSLLSGIFSWSMALLFIGLFVRYLSKPRAWVGYLSDASYWCYLLHLPVAVFLQIVVASWRWPGPVKYALVMAGTLAVCLASYHLLVRYSFVGTALNGKRVRAATP